MISTLQSRRMDMNKPKRVDFSDIPDHLKCKCENCTYEDQSIIGLGYVCVICAKYCDERVLEHLKLREMRKVVLANG